MLEWAKLLLAEPSFVGETLSIVIVHFRRRMVHHNFIGNTDCRHPRGGGPSNQHANAKDLDAWRMRGRSVGRSVSFAYFAVPNSPRILAEQRGPSFLPSSFLAGWAAAAGDLMWTSNYAPITDSIITERAREGVPQGWGSARVAGLVTLASWLRPIVHCAHVHTCSADRRCVGSVLSVREAEFRNHHPPSEGGSVSLSPLSHHRRRRSNDIIQRPSSLSLASRDHRVPSTPPSRSSD